MLKIKERPKHGRWIGLLRDGLSAMMDRGVRNEKTALPVTILPAAESASAVQDPLAGRRDPVEKTRLVYGLWASICGDDENRHR